MSKLKNQLAQQLNDAHSKYTYFLLAIAASAVAFAVQKTTGRPLVWSMLPLGIAVLLWACSFLAGCRNRAYFCSTIYANLALLQLQDGTHTESPEGPQAVAAACKGVQSAAESNSSATNLWGKLQFRLLVLGAVFFLVWHVLEMGSRTSARESSHLHPIRAAERAPLARLSNGLCSGQHGQC